MEEEEEEAIVLLSEVPLMRIKFKYVWKKWPGLNRGAQSGYLVQFLYVRPALSLFCGIRRRESVPSHWENNKIVSYVLP